MALHQPGATADFLTSHGLDGLDSLEATHLFQPSDSILNIQIEAEEILDAVERGER